MAKQKHKKEKPQRKIGLPPGTLVFTGKRFSEEVNVSLMQYDQELLVEKHLQNKKPDAMPGFPLTWFDIRGVHDLEIIDEVGKEYGIHPLALEDIVNTRQRPKFEEYPEGIFITLRALEFDEGTDDVKTEQVSIYFGHNFLLSFQEHADDLFVPVRARIEKKSGRLRQRGTDYLAYALIDNIVDSYFLVLDKMDERMEAIENDILNGIDKGIKTKIHELKLEALMLKKSIAPLREAINQFTRCDNPLVNEGTLLFVRDLHDHLIQVLDLIETQRDMIMGLNDLYISELSFKMNGVMKVLTMITTIFVPLSFLAGLYGMNFDYMPELRWKDGYFVLLGLMASIAIGLLIWFNRKRWL